MTMEPLSLITYPLVAFTRVLSGQKIKRHKLPAISRQSESHSNCHSKPRLPSDEWKYATGIWNLEYGWRHLCSRSRSAACLALGMLPSPSGAEQARNLSCHSRRWQQQQRPGVAQSHNNNSNQRGNGKKATTKIYETQKWREKANLNGDDDDDEVAAHCSDLGSRKGVEG